MSSYKLSKIRLNKENPRTISNDSCEKMRLSLIRFPQMMRINPIVIEEKDKGFEVLGGNQRIRQINHICQKMSLDEIIQILVQQFGTDRSEEEQKRYDEALEIWADIFGTRELPDEYVLIADGLSESEKQEYIIKANTHFGSWDMEDLANKWEAPVLENWGVNVSWGDSEEVEISEIGEDDVNMGYEFKIFCGNRDELEDVQKILGTTAKKTTYNKFLDICKK